MDKIGFSKYLEEKGAGLVENFCLDLNLKESKNNENPLQSRVIPRNRLSAALPSQDYN
jgi:hypothetical protein